MINKSPIIVIGQKLLVSRGKTPLKGGRVPLERIDESLIYLEIVFIAIIAIIKAFWIK